MSSPPRRSADCGLPSARDATWRGERGAVSKVLIAVVVLLLLGIFAWRMTVGTYNTMVAHREVVDEKWSAVGSQYQRRFELVPQLVAVVKGAADFEQSTIIAVTEARAKVGQINLSGAPTDAKQAQAFLEAQQGLSSALSRLLAVSEAYPQLTATAAFRDLQSQIEGTENRINVARLDYIAAIRSFNTSIRTFPANLIAGMYGFEHFPQLETDETVREVPTISFGDDDEEK
jgi:LemA protein